MKVRELYTDENKWIKGALARDSRGRLLTNPHTDEACCWCLYGAIMRCYGQSERKEVVTKINNFLNQNFSDDAFLSITDWNDHFATFTDVVKLVTDLDI